jgi:hypothetical protein
MQMAGGSAEQEDLKAELEAAQAENSKNGSISDKEGSAAPVEQEPTAPKHALSFLSPPKPKMRMELAAALQRPLMPLAKDLPAAAPKIGLPAPTASNMQPAKVSPINTVNTTFSQAQAPPSKLQLQLPQLQQPQQNVQQQHTQDISRGLLKVSARGSKPMPAPWQQGNEDDAAGTAAPVASASPCRDFAAQLNEKVVGEEEVVVVKENEEKVVIEEGKKESGVDELDKVRSMLAEMALAKHAAEKQAQEAKTALAEMEVKLEEVEEDLKTEATIRVAAEKRILSLETEIASLQASSADAGGCQGTLLGKIVEEATEVSSKFGLVEALLTAANALSQQVSSGRVLTENMVENVTAAQVAAAQAGEEGKTRVTRARRKSAWRG